MTGTEFVNAIDKEQFRERLLGKLNADYPGYSQDAEDVTQHTLGLGFRRCSKFVTLEHLWAWMRETSLQVMFDKVRKDKARRKRLREASLGNRKKRNDPYKRLDWKIDLERGISKTTHDLRVKAALWHIYFEDYEIQEVIDTMPTNERSREGWRGVVDRAKVRLTREMKRKGYRI